MEQPGKILIVDDDPTHLKLYSWIVNRGGYGATGALVNSSGLALCLSEKYDLVVMDYNFAGLATASSVATKIRAAYEGVPILVLSDQPYMPSDIAAFASAFVRKGDPELLLQTISSLMQKVRSA